MMDTILIIEDDNDIVDLLKIHLSDLAVNIHVSNDGETGVDMALKLSPDLIILDVMLPKLDGVQACQQIKANQLKVPIIMLTARSEEIDKVLGLEVGADDYMTKPFSIRELIARIKAIFRLRKMIKESLVDTDTSIMNLGDMTIDVEKRKVTVSNQRKDLSRKEFELLVLMASHPGRSYSREQLLNLIWGYDFSGYEHTVNSHINRLRSKIEPDMTAPTYILTTWGVGYKFNEEI